MRSKAIFMALLAFTFGAQAVPVSSDQAMTAARAWVYRGATLGARLGDVVEKVSTHQTTNGVSFYAVGMKGSGTVFMTADTEDGVVVAFTPEAGDYSTLDRNSPLWALLNRDIAVRRALRSKRPAQASAAGSTTATLSASEKLWAALLEEGAALSDPTVKLPARTYVTRPGDVRVEPLVQSKWDQSTIPTSGDRCYNYYTPKLSDSTYAVCGCVATAMSQIMRYHEWPVADVTPVTRECTVEAHTVGNPAANRSLTTQGGVYDWENMPLVPDNKTSTEQCKAIGKLTSDAGISVCMNYDTLEEGGSGAFCFNVAGALKGVFGYGNADYYGADEITANPSVVERALLSNFDAGYPVLMGIAGDGGHAIVGDGYGYSSEKLYVHLNMGWSGADDLWYNLPDIDTPTTHYHFTVFDDVVFNIFPQGTGAVFAGLVSLEDGTRLDGAEVIAYQGGTEVARATTTNGVFGIRLADGTYDFEATSDDGEYAGELKGRAVSATSSASEKMGGYIIYPSWVKYYSDIQYVTSVGNSWGNALTMYETEYGGSVSNVTRQIAYGTLDAAVEKANAGDVLEIRSATLLRAPLAIGKSVTIRTAAGVDPGEAVVTCRDAGSAGFTNVLSGATLTLENVCFSNTDASFVNVSAGGKLSVCGVIGLSDGTIVKTADADGIVLAGALESSLMIDCEASRGLNQAFGTFSCDYPTASASAAHFCNVYDEDLGGVAVSASDKLVWGRVEPAPDAAIAYFTANGGATCQYFRNLNKLLADHLTDAGDVVILKNCELKQATAVGGTKRLLCTNETAAVVTFAAGTEAVFTNVTGASLTVSNLVFTGAEQWGAFVMTGGELTLDAGTMIVGCTNRVDAEEEGGGGGAVSLYADESSNPAKLTMLSGSVISNCTAYKGYGGGVCVGRLWVGGCEFDMLGGKIVDCESEAYGGGVYVDISSTMRLKGDAVVKGCTSRYADGQADNIYTYTVDNLELVDELTGEVHVNLYMDNDPNTPFAVVAETCDDQAASNSAYRIWCDVQTDDQKDLHGRYQDGEEGRVLVWDDALIPVPEPPVENPVAWVITEFAGQLHTNAYATLDAAFASIKTDATVEITDFDYPLSNCTFTAETEEELAALARLTNGIPYLRKAVTISHNVVLKTVDNAADKTNVICRATNVTMTVVSGGKLTLRNVCLSGKFPEISTNEATNIHSYRWQTGGGKKIPMMIAVGTGGELVMDAGSVIRDVTGTQGSDSVAVCVGGGTFTMKDGAEIVDCICPSTAADPSLAGGVVVSTPDSVFRLEGGVIHRCGGRLGGGVYIGAGGYAYVSGSPVVEDNCLLMGLDQEPEQEPVLSSTNGNVLVALDVDGLYDGNLILAGEFTGSAGCLEPRLYLPDQEIQTNVFGRVGAEAGELWALVPSAAHFHRDAATGVTGRIVTNETAALLVWSTAVKDGVFTYAYEDPPGTVIEVKYYEVPGDPPGPGPEPEPEYADPTPIAFKAITRVAETEWGLVVTDRVQWAEYRLIWTDDLTKGFTTTGAWEQATQAGAWTTNVLFTAPAPAAIFWKAEGQRGEVPKGE